MIRLATLDDVPRMAELSDLTPAHLTDAFVRMDMLLDDHSMFFLERITPSVFEAHMVFEPEHRGKSAIASAKAGLAIAFGQLNAAVVFGRIPVEDRAARLLTRLIGFVSDGIRPRHEGGPLCEWFEMRSPALCHKHS